MGVPDTCRIGALQDPVSLSSVFGKEIKVFPLTGYAGNYPAIRIIGKMTAVLPEIVFLINGILYLL